MIEINILLLEDNNEEIENFSRAKEILEAENPEIKFNITNYKIISDEVFSKLLKNNFDFLIVDLKLANSWTWEWDEKLDWNKFLEHIHNNLNIPIIINTWNIWSLDSKFISENNPLFQAIDSLSFTPPEWSTKEKEILKKVFDIYSTWITLVIWKDWSINKVLNKLIWDWWLSNISKWKDFNDSEVANKSLSRYILSHLHHNLSWDYENFHSEEIYLKVIWDWKFDTGTILKSSNDWKYYIILTPACDIAQCNTDYYLVSQISDISVWVNQDIDISLLSENFEKLSNPNCDENCKKKAIEKIERAIKKMKSDDTKKTKFLPTSTLFKWWYINFEKLEKINKSEESNYEVVCYISSHFLKDIISDFGYYYSRQWQPNLNNDIIIKNLLNTTNTNA